mmetsp:Transcript_10587/g.26716  ORF Transcript_10587/g.26716 Transcript_10587/m.26716 type:complete len:224 (-) Transcript_10587:80-751(-)
MATMMNLRSIRLWYNPLISFMLTLTASADSKARAPVLVISFSASPNTRSEVLDSRVLASAMVPLSPIPLYPRCNFLRTQLCLFKLKESATNSAPSSCKQFPSRLSSNSVELVCKKEYDRWWLLSLDLVLLSLWLLLLGWFPDKSQISFWARFNIFRGIPTLFAPRDSRTDAAPFEPMQFSLRSSSSSVLEDLNRNSKAWTPRLPMRLPLSLKTLRLPPEVLLK